MESSQEYFQDDIEDSILKELGAIEAAAQTRYSAQTCYSAPHPLGPLPLAPNASQASSIYEDPFDFDEETMLLVDKAMHDAYRKQKITLPSLGHHFDGSASQVEVPGPSASVFSPLHGAHKLEERRTAGDEEETHSYHASSPAPASAGIPEASFPIQHSTRGHRTRRHHALSSSPVHEGPLHKRRRLLHSPDCAEARPRSPRAHNVQHHLYDCEADHSGSETSEGRSDSEHDVYSDGVDVVIHEKLTHSQTSISPSYDQEAMYQQSLLSQPLDGAPVFSTKLARCSRRPFVRNSPGVSSPPPIDGGVEDDYEVGSFVVDDDEDEALQ